MIREQRAQLCDEGRPEYFACFLAEATSAATPTVIYVRYMMLQHVLVTSQVMYLPVAHLINVVPSGRLPSMRHPCGFFELGMSSF